MVARKYRRRRTGSMILLALAYVADAFILSTYGLAVFTGVARPFHWANAIGGIPLLAVEILTGAWPVVPLTATFTVLGWVGVIPRKGNA